MGNSHKKTQLTAKFFNKIDYLDEIEFTEFGKVYEVYDRKSQQLLLLKTIFLRNISCQEKQSILNHILHISTSAQNWPNVNGNLAYLIEEFNSIKILRENKKMESLFVGLAKENGQFKINKSIELIYPIVKGLRQLRDSGIIYHNLCLETIIYQKEKKGKISVKIDDFLYSNLFPNKVERTFKPHIAPELHIQSEIAIITPQECKSKEDVWSVGCVLYEILFGELPLTSLKTFEEKLFKMKAKIHKRKDLPNFLKLILERSLQIQPIERLSLTELETILEKGVTKVSFRTIGKKGSTLSPLAFKTQIEKSKCESNVTNVNFKKKGNLFFDKLNEFKLSLSVDDSTCSTKCEIGREESRNHYFKDYTKLFNFEAEYQGRLIFIESNTLFISSKKDLNQCIYSKPLVYNSKSMFKLSKYDRKLYMREEHNKITEINLKILDLFDDKNAKEIKPIIQKTMNLSEKSYKFDLRIREKGLKGESQEEDKIADFMISSKDKKLIGITRFGILQVFNLLTGETMKVNLFQGKDNFLCRTLGFNQALGLITIGSIIFNKSNCYIANTISVFRMKGNAIEEFGFHLVDYHPKRIFNPYQGIHIKKDEFGNIVAYTIETTNNYLSAWLLKKDARTGLFQFINIAKRKKIREYKSTSVLCKDNESWSVGAKEDS